MAAPVSGRRMAYRASLALTMYCCSTGERLRFAMAPSPSARLINATRLVSIFFPNLCIESMESFRRRANPAAFFDPSLALSMILCACGRLIGLMPSPAMGWFIFPVSSLPSV
ncbi:P34 [Hamiltonella phage APSE-1]|uniref:Putative protein p34 n=1 Tax=Acyrthosiphon pisum secondary endosymbiont phage 1 TaxID=2682836 RepID=VP34_BPAPS|nr:hypothetical protein APSE-1_34 [Hamiltonella phage APSE-1]Q9T1R4.1 RecName: Full=Putative protein p34 [Hamiltonella phage APSE-1]AAF03977.1 P34 [Hamiltonella phage APSE-1]